MSHTSNVLFVCLGNICRSPAAHGVFQKMVDKADLAAQIRVDSCGTGAWHIGQPPDDRMQLEAKKRGYALSQLRARRLVAEDFTTFDYILAMDTRNLADVLKQAPKDFTGHIGLFMDYAKGSNTVDVPDPYYGEQDGFERVLSMVEAASQGLLNAIRAKND